VRALVDSSVLIAAARQRERLHGAAIAAISADEPRGLGTPITILAETMSFLHARVGVEGQRAFWDGFMRSGIEIIGVDLQLMEHARAIDRDYADAGFGFADCTLLAACERVGCARILSFDAQLRVYRPSFAGALEVVP